MKRASILAAVAAILSCSAALGNPVWTETFDNGVGRFNITTGDGSSVFIYDPIDQNLNGTFIREDSINNFIHNRRLADLGATFTESDAVSFSFDWTPLSGNDLFKTAILGFFDESNQLVMGSRISKAENNGVADYRVTGPWGQIRTSSWDFGETYRVEFSIDGPGGTFGLTTSVLQGNGFVLQDSGEWPLPNPVNYSFSQVGMQNLLDNEFGGSLTIDIDNFSFTPEPSTAMLLMVGSLVALRRGRRRE